MKKAIFVMEKKSFDLVYPSFIKEEIERNTEVIAPPLSREELLEDLSVLNDVEILFSGWGGPTIDQTLLDHAPNLRIVLYAAGSLKSIVTEEAWEREIIFSTAVQANAIPVAEFTLSQIIFSLKNGWQFVRETKQQAKFPNKPFMVPGTFKSKVGIISLSSVGRVLVNLLKVLDVEINAYDPFVTEEEAERLGVNLCSLEEIFKISDIVTLHAPLLLETTEMITGDHFCRMKEGATFINTARGAIVKEIEMIEQLKVRQDLTAVLDVTDPEPPSMHSPLFQLDNVVLTPHLAGSEGKECGRMGEYMLDEMKRYINEERLKWVKTKEQVLLMA